MIFFGKSVFRGWVAFAARVQSSQRNSPEVVGRVIVMKTHRFSRTVLFLPVLLCFMTETARANVGSGLLFPAIIHLLFLNVVIGVIEAFVVRKAFKKSPRVGIIILANYVSAFLGYVVVGLGGSVVGFHDTSKIATTMAVLFVASVLVEWPFFAWALNERMWSFSRTTFKCTFWAQCVSYALMIPYYFISTVFFMMMEGTGPPSSNVLVTMDAYNLSGSAYQYRLRLREIGGGGGSYRGFSIPERLWVQKFGRFEAVTSRDSIVFVARDSTGTRNLVHVVLDSTGKLHSWEYAYKPDDVQFREQMNRSFNYLAELAHHYRMRPLMKPGKGSYAAYSIPERMDLNKQWRWSSDVSEDSILFVARDAASARTILSVVVDSSDNLHSWEYTFEQGDDSFNEHVDSDIRDLASLAQKHRVRALSQGGDGGGYNGFTIPEKSSTTKYRRYAAEVSKDSIVFVVMNLRTGSVIESVVLDSTGTLHTCKWKLQIE